MSERGGKARRRRRRERSEGNDKRREREWIEGDREDKAYA